MWSLLRRYPDFRLLFIATVINLGGDWFATVALIGKTQQLGKGTWLTAAWASSLVFVCQMLPSFIVTPFAGPLADRFDRRRIMICASLLQAGFALLFLLPTRSTVWLAFAAQALVSSIAGFYSPASQAALANLIEPADLPRAAGLMGSTWGAMLALGAFLGAWFSATFGRNAAFIADAVSFVLAASVLLFIRTPTTRDRGVGTRPVMRPFADTAAALRIASGDRRLRLLLLSKGGFGLASGVVGVLAALATTRFGGGDEAIGLLLGARGVGVVLGPMIASRLGSRNDVPGILRACGISCIVYGIAYFCVARSPVLAVAVLFTVVAHLGGGTQWTLSTYGLQANTPDEIRGRIMSADMALVSLSMTISFIVAAVCERSFGATTAMTVLAVASMVWGTLYLRATRSLRSSVVVA